MVLLRKVQQASWRCDYYVDTSFQCLDLGILTDATEYAGVFKSGMAPEANEFLMDLQGQLSRRRENQRSRLPGSSGRRIFVQTLQ